MMALHLDVEWDANSAENLCSEGNIDYLRALGVDDTALFVGSVDCDSLGLVILRDDLVLRPE
jgi:hypothetical protein